MNEFSTAGTLLKYCAEQTAGVRPTQNYITIPNVKSTPDFNPEPSSIDVTDLSDTVWRRAVGGLMDIGGSLAFGANLTSNLKSVWDTLMSAYETAIASNKAIWFEVYVPNFASFYFAGKPSELGLGAFEVDSVAEVNLYITPNQVEGWADSSTTTTGSGG